MTSVLRCSHCSRVRPASGHDPCIENLPGVSFACCGHGGNRAFTGSEDWAIPYLVEKDETIYGRRAIIRMRQLGGIPPDFNLNDVLDRSGFDHVDTQWIRERAE